MTVPFALPRFQASDSSGCGNVCLEDFDVKFDGTDETVKVQAAADALSPGQTLTQHSSIPVMVSLVEFHVPHTRYLNLRLKTIDNAAGYSTPFCVNASGTYPNQDGHDLVFEDCYVNGNRSGQPNIASLGVGEDGGLHGFRIERGCVNITLTRCVAEQCATDGIILFNSGRAPREPLIGFPAGVPDIRGLRASDCEFVWNRRHGGSGFSFADVEFVRCRFNNNGQDLAPFVAANWQQGQYGARMSSAAPPYPNGVDLEQESSAVGRATWENVLFDACQFLNNARRGLLILFRGSRATSGYLAARNIAVRNCRSSVGNAPNAQTEDVIRIDTFTAPFAGQLQDLRGFECRNNVLVVPLGYTSSTPISCDLIDGGVVTGNRMEYSDGTSIPPTTIYTPPQCRSSVNVDVSGNLWAQRYAIAGQFNFSSNVIFLRGGEVLFRSVGLAQGSTINTLIADTAGEIVVTAHQANGTNKRMRLRLASSTDIAVLDAGGVGNSQTQKYIIATGGVPDTLYTVLNHSFASGRLQITHNGTSSSYSGLLDVTVYAGGSSVAGML